MADEDFGSTRTEVPGQVICKCQETGHTDIHLGKCQHPTETNDNWGQEHAGYCQACHDCIFGPPPHD